MSDRTAEPSNGPCENTDRHLWPPTAPHDAPHESIHVTAQGGIGINVAGCVYVKSLREWHNLAGGTAAFSLHHRPSDQRISRKDFRLGCQWCEVPTHGTADCWWVGQPRCLGGARHKAERAIPGDDNPPRCSRCGCRPGQTPSIDEPGKPLLPVKDHATEELVGFVVTAFQALYERCVTPAEQGQTISEREAVIYGLRTEQ